MLTRAWAASSTDCLRYRPEVEDPRQDGPGDTLMSAYDLETAVAAALSLFANGEMYGRYLDQTS